MSMPSPQYQSSPPSGGFGQRLSGARQRAKDVTGARAAQVVGPQLEPGEQMLAGARVHTGPSDWLRWAPYIRGFVRLMQRHYYVVVTDRRLIFCAISFWNGRPNKISWAVPRAGVRASDYTAGAIYPSFRLSFPTRSPMRLRIYSSYEPEVLQILNILGMPAAGGQPGAAPPYQASAAGYPPQGALPYQAPQQGYQQQGYQQQAPQRQAPQRQAPQQQTPSQGYPAAPYNQGQQYQPQQGYQQQQGYPQQGYESQSQQQNPQQGPGRHRGPGA